jgi:membrane dipeptidase
METIVNLQKVPGMLSEIGHAELDIQNIMSGNFIRFLKNNLVYQ